MKRADDAAVLVIGNQARSLTNFRGPLLQAMRERGHRVAAAAPRLNEDEACVEELGRIGVVSRDISLSRTGLNAFADLRTIASVLRLIREEKPQAVLCYTAKPVIFGTIAAALAGVPRRYALVTGLGYAFTVGGGPMRAVVRAVLMRLYRIASGGRLRCSFRTTTMPRCSASFACFRPRFRSWS